MATKAIEALSWALRTSCVDEDSVLVPQDTVRNVLELLKGLEPVKPMAIDATMFACGNCRFALPRTANFCWKCGRKVERSGNYEEVHCDPS